MPAHADVLEAVEGNRANMPGSLPAQTDVIRLSRRPISVTSASSTKPSNPIGTKL